MSAQLLTAINNRDGAAMARMACGRYEPDKVINSEAEALVDSLFRQLKQIFPAAVSTSLRNEAVEKTTKRQWIVAFAENGIKTREQLSAGVRRARASNSDFWPSPGKFISWCKDSSTILGITQNDVMTEFRKYNSRKGGYTTPEQYPWPKPIFYWIVLDMRYAMLQRQLSESEVEKFASRKLDEWSKKVAAGEAIPDPVARLESKNTVMHSVTSQSNDLSIHYMPNASALGSVTPAQWLHAEFKRRKSAGLV
ncbi:Replication protein P [Izhakiella capsodis]|uniref:Replication protein P n=1 Tax=Izhakiella capsodis TaxID=1367852 RepID=A0A1I5BSJ1_9GAMM|nr:replication protein P [Izhakiella capsodis]SFN77705.1 Replication protein P [Izhakiella capsodis]